MYTIICEQLTKTFESPRGSITPIKDLSLTFEQGSINAIIGQSGCGKTTLLRLLAGLDTPTDGSIRFCGTSKTPRISVVFQEPRLFPWFNVRENIRLSVRHLEYEQQNRFVNEALELVRLTHVAEANPTELSGGMAQRVGLARALCPHPDIILLDEAFSALDALTRTQLHDEFMAIHAILPMTTVLVTHDVTEAVLLASRIYRLGTGTLKAIYDVTFPYPRRLSFPGVAEMSDEILTAFIVEERI
ncbi:ABC transporter ATP-binding protein [Escherichia coli]|uniref:ABC transporter ATP-binding protein n=1 Tax=Escherichia coli TaxID=562 RepID=UPI002FC96B79